jgi:hypothetical protein
MDENVGKSPDRVENAEWQNRLKLDAEGVSDDFALASDGQAMTSSSADTAKDEPDRAAPGPARNEILPHSLRLPMIAAALAATAALGSFAGSLTASGVTQFWPRVAPSSSSVAASEGQASNVELAALSALKTYVEGASRNANHQFATLADRLDRIERTQAEPNVKLARIAEAVDRLEKQRKSAVAPAAAAPEITGTVPNSRSAPAEAKILPNWILHGVRGRHALVENSQGDLFEITDDSTLPGLGRVEGVKRQDGQWVVVTARGLITSAP